MFDVLNINGVPKPHRVVPMPSDGSCLFHSLSYLIYGNTQMTLAIRLNIVNYVVDNWERFVNLNVHDFPTKEQYREAMSNPWTFGTTCELVAAGEIYPYQFQVYIDGKLLYSFGFPGHLVRKLRFTGDLDNGHFDAYFY
jgi:hypothetical protein